jgi:hypothetical protein
MLKKSVDCKVCAKAGKKINHLGLCHKCPHLEEVQKGLYKSYEESPCSFCTPSDSRAQGHGRGLQFDEVVYGGSYIEAPDMPDEQPEYTLSKEILYAFSSLTPQEFYAFYECIYSSKMLKDVAESGGNIFKEPLSINKVFSLRNKATEKLRTVLEGKLQRGTLNLENI